jgi:flagellar hook protein FlgE
MGILASLYTGVTGINGQGEALSVYGDNIANASTNGFKVSRPEFQDVMSKSLKGLLGGNQIGRGVKLAAVTPLFNQGSVLQTESPTDLAINGEGFFVLKGQDGQSYTRNGAFHFDREGKLVNSDNFRVLGFQADESGKITSKMGEVSIDRGVIDAKKTINVDMFLNLDLRADVNKVFNPANPDGTSHFTTGVTVYDTAGSAHVISLCFNKTGDGAWTWRAMAKGEEVTNGRAGEMFECAKGELTFDTDGRLRQQRTLNSEFNFNKGALPNQKISFNFGPDKSSGGAGVQVTQYGTVSEAYKTTQDGYTAGTLSGLTFSDDGILTAMYSNGENVNMCQVAVGKFESPEGLFKTGQNRFKESRLSGQATIGVPQTGGRGRLSSKTIESSTTDITQEFVNLMQAQRNFQANSKVVSTSDDMLQEILNLKRG